MGAMPLRSEKEALTVVLRTWEDLFAECTRSMCVCVCLLLYGMGIAACARQLEWKQHCPRPTTHESGGLSSTHENIFHPPCFIFNQTFVALTVRFNQICLLSFLVDQTSNWILVRRRSIVNLFLFDLSKYRSHYRVMSMSEVIMNA